MNRKKIKIAVVLNQNTENRCVLKGFMEMLERESDIETVCISYPLEKQKNLIGEIKALRPDLLITADLSGFEQCTLTDNVSYNLLDCKQLHLLLHEKLPNEQYLKKQQSIAMFFYCAGNAYYEYLHKYYPHLPYLKQIPDWQLEKNGKAAGKNAACLRAVLLEALRESRILL
ncbi:MAG: hypothetical protein NC305_06905 [Lachnospiraceae bacterium]|nr:hypothetical protein [Butyrivibrio sp.]MCM1342433.1 hypothetical protein [Muribaculaceae bacterium]MCM1410260.1 hypothetical protein [Lachnospiraceae bacterium]